MFSHHDVQMTYILNPNLFETFFDFRMKFKKKKNFEPLSINNN